MTRASVGGRVTVVVLVEARRALFEARAAAAGSAWIARTMPKAGSVNRIDPAISSQVGADLGGEPSVALHAAGLARR